jgi:ubiquinone/menaquinone biosynthesis C-methylase UbiE
VGEVNLMQYYPRTKRPIEGRARTVTETDRALSRQFGRDYFDGDRMHGYGGYAYHPRFWTETVRHFRDYYRLAEDASVLDVGCAKGFMLHDFKVLMPKLTVAGLDVSQYAYDQAMPDVKPFITIGNCKQLPYPDRSFDLVISINTVHNLPLEGCKQAIREIQRVSKAHSFIMVDAWRTEEERKRLEQWVVTCLTAMHVDDWKRLFKDMGYAGDYYWFIAE